MVRFLTFHLNSRPRSNSLLPPRLLSVLLSSTRSLIHVWVPTCATISIAESRVAIQRALGGDQLGGPSLCGSCSGESVSPASSPTRTHPFFNCGEKDRGRISVIYQPEAAYKYQMAGTRKRIFHSDRAERLTRVEASPLARQGHL